MEDVVGRSRNMLNIVCDSVLRGIAVWKKVDVLETAEQVRVFIRRDTSSVLSHGTRNQEMRMVRDGRVRW